MPLPLGIAGDSILTRLRAPFPMGKVKYYPKVVYPEKDGKPASALVLFYITKQAARDRLDEVFGPGGWKMEVTPLFEKAAVLVTISCKIDGEWVQRVGLGGEKKMKEEKDSHKSGLTDGFRNACAYWGIGAYLDDLDPIYWPINDKFTPARFYYDNDGPPLRRYGYDLPHCGKPRLPREFLPAPDKREPQPQKDAGRVTPQQPTIVPAAPAGGIPSGAAERSATWRQWFLRQYADCKSAEGLAAVDARLTPGNRSVILTEDLAAIDVARNLAQQSVTQTVP